jgi:hypothetical protein
MVDVQEDAEYFIDLENIVDEFDETLFQIAETSAGIRIILDAHLDGTTNSGSNGLIARLACQAAKPPVKRSRKSTDK